MVNGIAIGIPFFKIPVLEESGEGVITGLLDFDGVNDSISFGSLPDVSGIKTITFSLYLLNDSGYTNPTFILSTDDNNVPGSNALQIYLDGNTINIVSNQGSLGKQYSITDLNNQILDFIVHKNNKTITDVYINGIIQTPLVPTPNIYSTSPIFSIGALDAVLLLNNTYIWDININNEHAYSGRPNGNLDTAWVDTIGDINGTVHGTPDTIDLVI